MERRWSIYANDTGGHGDSEIKKIKSNVNLYKASVAFKFKLGGGQENDLLIVKLQA